MAAARIAVVLMPAAVIVPAMMAALMLAAAAAAAVPLAGMVTGAEVPGRRRCWGVERDGDANGDIDDVSDCDSRDQGNGTAGGVECAGGAGNDVDGADDSDGRDGDLVATGSNGGRSAMGLWAAALSWVGSAAKNGGGRARRQRVEQLMRTARRRHGPCRRWAWRRLVWQG